MKFKGIYFLVFIVLSNTSLYAQNGDTLRIIKFDGSLKTKFEYATETSKSRFSVRNSRMGISGSPFKSVSYRVQVELSNQGKFEVLDLSATIEPFKNLTFTLGQTSIPLYNSYQTTPSQMLFANRSFHVKYFVPGTRDIGLSGHYTTLVYGVPLDLKAGIFNASKINDPVWTEKISWGMSVTAGQMRGLRASAKIYRYPAGERDLFVWGGDVRYGGDRYKLEAEFLSRKNLFDNQILNSASLQGAYSFPLKNTRIFKDITPALRWDMMGRTDNDNLIDAGRITAGLSFGFDTKPFSSLLRIDFEKYTVNRMLPELNLYEEMDSDKLTIELLIVF
ncbi:MAG: porin [Bacteroidales bacterium]